MGGFRSTPDAWRVAAPVHRQERFRRYIHGMFKLFRPIAALTALFAALLSPQASARTAEEAVRPALWKVADKDTTIYLFGTVHALPPGIPWYRGEIATAFEESQELVTEIIDEDQASVQKAVAATAILPAGQTLRGMMTAEERTKYEAALSKAGVQPATFDQVEPWFAAITLAVIPLAKDGFLPQNGVEGLLDAKAKTLGHEHGALETAAYQLGLFDSLAPEVQKRFLMEVVENLPTVTTDLSRIVEAWKAGDVEQVAELMKEQDNDSVVLDTILFKRNKNWADWIKTRLDKPGRVFIAVGAGHLAGPGSVQEKLHELGIASTRIQ
jgi:uncharacterized protein